MIEHPRDILFGSHGQLIALPVCEHFAGNQRFFEKAFALQAPAPHRFDITLDLEDGAPTGKEAAAAAWAADILLALPADYAGRVGVRIHDPQHIAWRDDVFALRRAADALAYITVPKVSSLAEARTVAEAIHSTLGRTVELHFLIETHGALREVYDIARLPGTATLDFGLMDFVSGHHGALDDSTMRSPAQFTHHVIVAAKTKIVSAALATGIVPSHNVTTAIARPEQAGDDAARARGEFGFLRMWSIHPGQIEPIIAAMAPSHDALAQAERVLHAARDASWGPVRVDDTLHDRASFRYYYTLMLRAHAGGVHIPAWLRPLK